MGYTDISFLDTKQEHDRWHHGIYKGLVIHNPQTLTKNLRANDKEWRQWYKDDDHYHDMSMLGSFMVKYASYGAGLYFLRSVGIL